MLRAISGSTRRVAGTQYLTRATPSVSLQPWKNWHYNYTGCSMPMLSAYKFTR